MKSTLKKVFAAAAAAVIALAMIFVQAPVSSLAASGSYYVSASSLSLTVGDSGGFSFGATNAVGFFTIDTDGGISASCSSELFVDNNSVYITVTANTIGTGHVYVTVYDGTDYDENDLSGKSYTVTVTVTQPETAVYNGSTNTTETTTSSTTAATTTTAETTTEEETTTVDPEIELLTVTVDNAEMLVLKDLSDITLPGSFEIEETEYNTVTVETMICGDIVLYVLENTDDNTTDYYTLNEETGEFELLRYTDISKLGFCIFLDFPDNLEIPYGYSLITTEIYGCDVEALVVTEEETETETESETAEEEEDDAVSLTAVSAGAALFTADTDDSNSEDDAGDADDEAAETTETASASDTTTIDDLAASPDGHYYVYCLIKGEKVLCDYDSDLNTLQRCVSLLAIESETEAETEVVIVETEAETEPEEKGLTGVAKGLLIAVIIACVVIVALAIILVVLLAKKKQQGEAEDNDENYGDITETGEAGEALESEGEAGEEAAGDALQGLSAEAAGGEPAGTVAAVADEGDDELAGIIEEISLEDLLVSLQEPDGEDTPEDTPDTESTGADIVQADIEATDIEAADAESAEAAEEETADETSDEIEGTESCDADDTQPEEEPAEEEVSEEAAEPEKESSEKTGTLDLSTFLGEIDLEDMISNAQSEDD